MAHTNHPSHPSRRIFLMQVAATTGTLATLQAQAQTPAPKVDEKDPQAVALGYVSDTTKANQTKYPKHTKDQACGACQLFQGKATDATGLCPIFAGRQVSSHGWCSSFIKKAG
jgi:hypothetical protein